MKKLARISVTLLLVSSLSACSIHMNSLNRAGIAEKLTNCVTDALDPQNRGSGCN